MDFKKAPSYGGSSIPFCPEHEELSLFPRPFRLFSPSIAFYLLDETLSFGFRYPLAGFLIDLESVCLGHGDIPHHIAAFAEI
jgi:hypothetical protein